jgi:hypothetical protein
MTDFFFFIVLKLVGQLICPPVLCYEQGKTNWGNPLYPFECIFII